MSTPMPKVESGGGIQGIATLLNTLAPMFGTGKQKTTGGGGTAVTTADPAALGQLDELLKKVLGGTDEGAIDDMVANILTRAKQEFGPAMIGTKAAGLRGYSDTVRAQMANEAMARATGEAAAAKLQAINANNKIAAGLVDSKVQASKTVRDTRNEQTQRTGMSPMGTALGLGLTAAQIYALMKKKKPTSADIKAAGGTETGADVAMGDYGRTISGDFETGYAATQEAGIDLESFGPSGGGADAALIDNLILESAAGGGTTPDTFTSSIMSAEAGPGAVDLTNTTASLFGAENVITPDATPVADIITSQGMQVGAAMPAAQYSMPPAITIEEAGLETALAEEGVAEIGATEGAAQTDIAGYGEYVPYAAAAYAAAEGSPRAGMGMAAGTFVGNLFVPGVGGAVGGFLGGVLGPTVMEASEDFWTNEVADDVLGLGEHARQGVLALHDPMAHMTSEDMTTEQKIETGIDPMGAVLADVTGIEELDPLTKTGLGEEIGEIGAGILGGAEDVIDEIFGGGGCFITTAATNNGELDNGFTLRTLREFRDTWMQDTPERRSELLDYYLIAPVVVKRINESRNSDALWQKIREDFLVPAVAYYYMDMPYQTHEVYKKMIYWARQQVGLANPGRRI
jgi:hypothetical protein